jgi:hypothetical protein
MFDIDYPNMEIAILLIRRNVFKMVCGYSKSFVYSYYKLIRYLLAGG